MPPVFHWLQQLGEIDEDEMFRVFNMGIGLVMIVSPYLCRQHSPHVADPTGWTAWRSAQLSRGPGGVEWEDA